MEIRGHEHCDRLPQNLGRRPAEHRFGRRVERTDCAVHTDGEDSFRRVLDDRAVMRLTALRVVSCPSCLHRLFCEQHLGAFLVLADRACHPNGDREDERSQEPDGLGLCGAQEGRDPSSEHQQLTCRAARQRPAERGTPRRGARLLEISERGERVYHPQRRTPTAHIDDRRHRSHVDEHSNVEPKRPGRRVRPPFDQPARHLRSDDDSGVRPNRNLGDQPEVTKRQEQHERDRADDIGQERGRQATWRERRGRRNASGRVTTRSGPLGREPDRSLVHLSKIDSSPSPL